MARTRRAAVAATNGGDDAPREDTEERERRSWSKKGKGAANWLGQRETGKASWLGNKERGQAGRLAGWLAGGN